LLLIGPVDAVNAQAGFVTILGQKLAYSEAKKLVAGDTAAVFGVAKANGSFVATSIVDQGRYVAGATIIFLSGKVQKSDSAVGRVTVDGLAVDLTATMSNGAVAPAVGTALQITGTQPNAGGLVVASGISGSGDGASLGISGSGASLGISGSGASLGISGSGTSKNLGISGSGASLGISGSGAALGISGSGASLGISGSGASLGISGSGASLGISGSGPSPSLGVSG
jgi:hypothetical protein